VKDAIRVAREVNDAAGVGGAELDDAGVVVGTASDGVDGLEAASGRVVGQVERGGPGRWCHDASSH
jgi:hypothetical protein